MRPSEPGSCGGGRRPRASLRGVQPDAHVRSSPPGSTPQTVREAARLALDGLLALGELGEDIDDEWTYVQDLVGAWQSRLEELEAARGDEPLAASRGAAVARIVDEAHLIEDPHRAIDWLSTLPQVALVALGERP
jgi:hypothetical protein